MSWILVEAAIRKFDTKFIDLDKWDGECRHFSCLISSIAQELTVLRAITAHDMSTRAPTYHTILMWFQCLGKCHNFKRSNFQQEKPSSATGRHCRVQKQTRNLNKHSFEGPMRHHQCIRLISIVGRIVVTSSKKYQRVSFICWSNVHQNLLLIPIRWHQTSLNLEHRRQYITIKVEQEIDRFPTSKPSAEMNDLL